MDIESVVSNCHNYNLTYKLKIILNCFVLKYNDL